MEKRYCSSCGKKLPEWSESNKCFECIDKCLMQLFKKEFQIKKKEKIKSEIETT